MPAGMPRNGDAGSIGRRKALEIGPTRVNAKPPALAAAVIFGEPKVKVETLESV